MHQLPILAALNDARSGDELVLYALTLSLKIQVVEGPINVQWSGFAIQIHAQPVIHLKGEDIGRGANLQHQRIFAGAVQCAVGN